jgi:hypothetical protein
MVVSQLKTLESSWSGGNEENYKTPQWTLLGLRAGLWTCRLPEYEA